MTKLFLDIIYSNTNNLPDLFIQFYDMKNESFLKDIPTDLINIPQHLKARDDFEYATAQEEATATLNMFMTQKINPVKN